MSYSKRLGSLDVKVFRVLDPSVNMPVYAKKIIVLKIGHQMPSQISPNKRKLHRYHQNFLQFQGHAIMYFAFLTPFIIMVIGSAQELFYLVYDY